MYGALAPEVSLDNDRVHVELWTSFASLLRSYAAAHGLNSRHQAVVEVGADQITASRRHSLAPLHAQALDDSEDNNRTVPFHLNEDGTVNRERHHRRDGPCRRKAGAGDDAK